MTPTFASPKLLWLALGVPVALLYLVIRERQRVAAARRFVSERLRGVANPARVMRPLLIALALLAGVVAVAGPQAGFTVMPVEQRESNRVLVIDVSLSMSVSSIAVVATAGATIPDPAARGPLRDDNGEVVTTAAHPDALRRIASATGGKFFDNPFAEHALDPLAASGGTMRRTTVRVPVERYQWPLAFAVAFLFLGSLLHRGAE